MKPRVSSVQQPASNWERTYYIHDAQGNPMAIYHRTYQANGGTSYTDRFKQEDALIYGSKRLGNWHGARLKQRGLTSATTAMTGVTYSAVPSDFWTNGQGGYPTTALSVTRELGLRQYELSNHLGNVLSTVSDRRLAVSSGSVLAYYRADEKSYADYDPYGMLLPGRFGGGFADQNFGFQGQLKDDELNGSTGTSYAFEYRIHDPRVGRFLSIDPLAKKYPYYSSYSFSGNRTMDMIELEGCEPTEPVPNWRVLNNTTPSHPYTTGNTYNVEEGGVIMEVIVFSNGTHDPIYGWRNPNGESGKKWQKFEPLCPNSPIPEPEGPNLGRPFQDGPYLAAKARELGRHDAELGGRFSDYMSGGLLATAMAGSSLGLLGPLCASGESFYSSEFVTTVLRPAVIKLLTLAGRDRLLAGGANAAGQAMFGDGKYDVNGGFWSMATGNPFVGSAMSSIGTLTLEDGLTRNPMDVFAAQLVFGVGGGLATSHFGTGEWLKYRASNPNESLLTEVAGYFGFGLSVNGIQAGEQQTKP
jgi:RHS repeat-associated protein